MAKLKDYQFFPAKFYSGRRGHEPKIVVMHYTAGRGNSAQLGAFFARGSREASAHFGVGRMGDVLQMVDTDKSAWHAGKSKFRDFRTPVGWNSIGIEVCNTGWAYLDSKQSEEIFLGEHRHPASNSKKWEAYTDDQATAIEKLIAELKEAHPTLQYVTGHEDIRNNFVIDTAGSKLDPGPAFPWDKINWSGLEQWHFSFRDKEWYNVPQGEKPTH
jgi:N-acetyl-anhydromuramyl-L-alanine amidase AmpD